MVQIDHNRPRYSWATYANSLALSTTLLNYGPMRQWVLTSLLQLAARRNIPYTAEVFDDCGPLSVHFFACLRVD